MNNKALYNLTYGVYLLTAQADGKDNACIINTAVQVAINPTRISLAVIKDTLTHDMILATGKCNLTSLSTGAPFSLFRHFGMQSGKDVDKFADFSDVLRSENGLYYLTKHATAYLSLTIVEAHDLGSHTLFIGELVDAEVLAADENCTYGYYQTVIKKTAPQPDVKVGWRCKVCNHVYEGEVLPEGYVCPICKHGAEDFERIGADTTPVNTAKVKPSTNGTKKYVCGVCGYVHEGDSAPEKCPQCGVPADLFEEREDTEMTWAAEHIVGIGKKDADEEIIEGLRANFQGECTEVGMYLAMARVAHREGYPEIGLYWEKAAYEEAEHAAKFAELLGEVVTDSTKKNLEMRVAAENGATAGKFQLAKMAKALNLDAIHDTVHEMARDEARHGKAFAGLLERYFK